MIGLYDHQLKALDKMKNGCILNGGVGSGKTRTSLAYWYTVCGGDVKSKQYKPPTKPIDLYIITIAKKRDDLDWDEDMIPFMMSSIKENNKHDCNIVVDSWNNIGKYKYVRDAFFIFDEQRVVGKGAWVNAFNIITKNNQWILLSATPGDNWSDYIPVFIANGFFRNRTEFKEQHIILNPWTNYEKIDRYINTRRLVRLRERILIDMDFDRKTKPIFHDIIVDYPHFECKKMNKERWNPWKEEPMINAAELCYSLRRLVNSDPSRIDALLDILGKTPRAIIFYNFDYELEILEKLCVDIKREYAQWNGHKHQPIPDNDTWVYLVQYTAGAEGWNCIKTDTIIFYSQNYSYKVLAQARGRIDRLNTPFTELHYYTLKSKAPIDMAIERTIKDKKRFNERKFTKWDSVEIKRSKFNDKYGIA